MLGAFLVLLSLQTKAAKVAPVSKCLSYFVSDFLGLDPAYVATKVSPCSPRLGVQPWEELVVTVLDNKNVDVVELACASVIDVQTKKYIRYRLLCMISIH